MLHSNAKPEPSTLCGIHAVEAALGRRPIDHVLVTQGHHGPRVERIIQACRAHGIPLRFAPLAALDRAAGATHHQNVVAVCPAKAYDDLESILAVAVMSSSPDAGEDTGATALPKPLLLVLDGVEDPANLGAVARTAVAAGVTGIVIPERRAAGLSPAVARAAAGALEHVKIARVTNLTRAIIEIKRRQVWVYGFEAKAEKSYLDLDYLLPCALVFGGEGHGLHRLVREACDQIAAIPIYGQVESLNVSVAAAVVLYEAARQRHARPL